MADGSTEAADDEGPGAGLFATETMAELSARQGRLADALAIYRHLVRAAETNGGPADDAQAQRLARWKARLAELERGEPATGQAAPAARPPAAAQPAPPAEPARAPERQRPSLLIRDTVRSGQLIYADGRDLIVVASVNPGAQLLADGHIHVYGALKGRAIAGARGLRDAQVFCLALDPELVGVDAGYLTAEDIPEPVRGTAARIFLTEKGTCAIAALTPSRFGAVQPKMRS